MKTHFEPLVKERRFLECCGGRAVEMFLASADIEKVDCSRCRKIAAKRALVVGTEIDVARHSRWLKPPGPPPALRDDAIYIGDNGRVHCGALACAGMSAHYTGVALDGEIVVEVDASIIEEFLGQGQGQPKCENCGATVIEVKKSA